MPFVETLHRLLLSHCVCVCVCVCVCAWGGGDVSVDVTATMLFVPSFSVHCNLCGCNKNSSFLLFVLLQRGALECLLITDSTGVGRVGQWLTMKKPPMVGTSTEG